MMVAATAHSTSLVILLWSIAFHDMEEKWYRENDSAIMKQCVRCFQIEGR